MIKLKAINNIVKNIAWLWVKLSDFCENNTVIAKFIHDNILLLWIYLFPFFKKIFVTVYQYCKYYPAAPNNFTSYKNNENIMCQLQKKHCKQNF